MQFQIRRIINNEWEIQPCDGQFAGTVIGTADGVCMHDVVFSNKVLSGDITAIWGLSLDPKVYSDIQTLKGLKIGKSFDTRPSRRTTEDFDGYLFARNMPCKAADRVTVIGAEVFVKGER